MRHALLINPPIYDFSALDHWAKPLGLLYLAAFLRTQGVAVSYLDCLDYAPPPGKVREKGEQFPKDKGFGRNNYYSRQVPTPEPLKGFPRYFKRYGMPIDIVFERLSSFDPPDHILVTCIMTYWYPGAAELIASCRNIFPQARIILGGIYPTLCPEHALEHCRPDLVAKEDGLSFLARYLGHPHPRQPYDFGSYPDPAIDLIAHPKYLPVMTSMGCPYHCHFCAARMLSSRYSSKPPNDIADYIARQVRLFGIGDLAFYDDALLYDLDDLFIPLARRLAAFEPKLRIHTPNAVFAGAIDRRIAGYLFDAGFTTLKIGVETLSDRFHEDCSGKNRRLDLELMIETLIEAGFSAEQIGFYMMIGLPGQSFDEVLTMVERLKVYRVKINLNELSYIPGTRYFDELPGDSPIRREPLLQNNTLLGFHSKEFSLDRIHLLKRMLV